MDILCPLTKWQDNECTRGRGAGNTTTTRLVIAFFKYSIDFGMINKARPDALAPGSKSYPNFHLALPAIHRYYPDLVMDRVIQGVVDALNKCTGDNFKIDSCAILGSTGRQIDDHFKVNYFFDGDPRARLFKGNTSLVGAEA